MLPLINYIREIQYLIETCSIQRPSISNPQILKSTEQVNTNSSTCFSEKHNFSLWLKNHYLLFSCFFAASSHNPRSAEGQWTRLEFGLCYISWCTTKSEKNSKIKSIQIIKLQKSYSTITKRHSAGTQGGKWSTDLYTTGSFFLHKNETMENDNVSLILTTLNSYILSYYKGFIQLWEKTR